MRGKRLLCAGLLCALLLGLFGNCFQSLILEVQLNLIQLKQSFVLGDD